MELRSTHFLEHVDFEATKGFLMHVHLLCSKSSCFLPVAAAGGEQQPFLHSDLCLQAAALSMWHTVLLHSPG